MSYYIFLGLYFFFSSLGVVSLVIGWFQYAGECARAKTVGEKIGAGETFLDISIKLILWIGLTKFLFF